ncbi:hypothetical protein ANO14919_018370 [Xylariales sp. No.14919]|nr:hypothetical protein ANO14919_018370 [Xylariales sp. No.14919]
MSNVTGAQEGQEERPIHFTRGRLSRGRGLRNTTGCLVCRKRRVKCDEVKPTCGGCCRTKNSCLYSNQGSEAQRPAVTDQEAAIEATSIPTQTSGSGQETSPDSGRSDRPESQLDEVLVEDNRQSAPIVASSPSTTVEITPSTSEAANIGPFDQSDVQAPPLDPSLSTIAMCPPQEAVSTTSSSDYAVETATARWLGLLFEDAVIRNEDLCNMNFEVEGFDIFGNSVAQSPVCSPQMDVPHHLEQHTSTPPSSNPSLSERNTILNPGQVFEAKEWQSGLPIQMSPYEHIAFQRFIRHISKWMDLFDPARSFETHVPRLAVHNVGLMNAILALSVRYMSMNPNEKGNYKPMAHEALQYYYKTLHYIQKAMQYNTYKTSLELVATSLIISSFEMLEGSSQDWERHLHGVFWIQRSQVIHGDSKGLRQAVWWAWLCQDIFAAYLDKRKPFTFWRPLRSLADLDPYELAARSVYYFAQCVGYSSSEEIEAGKREPLSRISKGALLRGYLQEWRGYLTVEFQPLPLPSTERKVFDPLWIHPSAFAVAMQLYHASNILLHMHSPVAGNYSEYARSRKGLRSDIQAICGIAMTLDDYASAATCSQCLFIAGLPMENPDQRCALLELLDNCRRRAGWPVRSLHNKLIESWRSMD